MRELLWRDRFPQADLKAGIKLLERLYWHIRIDGRGQEWNVWSGESLIFKSDSEEAVDSFLYGLALTYVVLPRSVLDHLSDEIKGWVE